MSYYSNISVPSKSKTAKGWVDNARLAVQSIEKAQRRPGRRVTAEVHGTVCCFTD
jgi:hypothetical protein